MIFWLAVFIILFIIQFIVSKKLLKGFYQLYLLLFSSKNAAVQIITLFLLPGTIIHEISHMLIAELLRVPTGKISFIPEVIEDKKIKAGSINIAKTDPFRHAVIGLAPVLIGLLSIALISFVFFKPFLENPNNLLHLQPLNYLLGLLFIYLLFSISNTMFSSKEDLKTILFPIILLALVFIVFWYLGINIKIAFTEKFNTFADNFFSRLSYGLGLVIFINILLFLLNKLFLNILLKFKKVEIQT
ncbi:hypothetical protein ACFLZ1_00460 [Patescibacteria group bacterium]